ncbi:MAG: N-acetylmuramoyl-L-alanine amidase [Actinomycetota bacterium]
MPARRRRRRSLLPVGAALSVVATAAFVAMPGQEGAAPPEVTTEQVDLTQPAEPVPPGWTGEAEVGPELVGVEWQGDPAAEFTIETRDADGVWSPAGTIGAPPADEGPDDGSREAGRREGNVSEALWVGSDTTGVRVHLDEGAAADVDLHSVESPPATAPDGAAVAADGPVLVGGGAGPGDRLMIAAAALVAAGLVVVAFRWRSTDRRRRRRLTAGALLVLALGLTGCIRPPAPPPRPVVPPVGNMITRAQWGADENIRLTNCPDGPEYMQSVKLAVVHHTVNSNDYGASEGPQLVRGIYAYHTQSLGYCDIAYNFLIDRFGNTYEGRYGGTENAVLGAHARGFNLLSTGISLIGDFRTVSPTPEAMEALEQLLAWKLGVHKINPWVGFYYQTPGNEKYAPGTEVAITPITIHNYTGNTECPGAMLINRMGEVHNEVSRRMGYS